MRRTAKTMRKKPKWRGDYKVLEALEARLRAAGCTVSLHDFGLLNVRREGRFLSWWPFSAKRFAKDPHTGIKEAGVTEDRFMELLAGARLRSCPPAWRPRSSTPSPEPSPLDRMLDEALEHLESIRDEARVAHRQQPEGQSDGAKPTAIQRDLASLAVRLVAAEARIEALEAAREVLDTP